MQRSPSRYGPTWNIVETVELMPQVTEIMWLLLLVFEDWFVTQHGGKRGLYFRMHVTAGTGRNSSYEAGRG